jgi:hypothetical protein
MPVTHVPVSARSLSSVQIQLAACCIRRGRDGCCQMHDPHTFVAAGESARESIDHCGASTGRRRQVHRSCTLSSQRPASRTPRQPPRCTGPHAAHRRRSPRCPGGSRPASGTPRSVRWIRHLHVLHAGAPTAYSRLAAYVDADRSRYDIPEEGGTHTVTHIVWSPRVALDKT